MYDDPSLAPEPPASDDLASGWSKLGDVALKGLSRFIDSEFRGAPQVPSSTQGQATGITSQGATYPRGGLALSPATVNPLWIVAGVAVIGGLGVLVYAIARK